MDYKYIHVKKSIFLSFSEIQWMKIAFDSIVKSTACR